MEESRQLAGALWRFCATGERTPAPADASESWPWVFFFAASAVLLVVNVAATQLVAMNVARAMLGSKVKAAKLEKFAQSFMEFWTYSGFFLLGVLVTYEQEWAWPSKLWWYDHADSSENSQVRSLGLETRCFYVLYSCRYAQQMFTVIFLENRRSDFLEMCLHHATTVILVTLSYMGDYVRVGMIVMVLLDVGDPPLHMAKMCKYVSEVKGPKKSLWSMLADVWFGIFALDFTVTRVFLFGYVVWSSTFELYMVATPELSWTRGVEKLGSNPVLCWLMLWVLLALQLFWEVLLLKAIWKVLTQGELSDVRSDDDESEQDKGGKQE